MDAIGSFFVKRAQIAVELEQANRLSLKTIPFYERHGLSEPPDARADSWKVLGVARYRARDWGGAIAASFCRCAGSSMIVSRSYKRR